MWTMIFATLSSISFFLVAWIIDSSTTNAFLGDKETTRNLLTIPLALLGIVFLFQAGITATLSYGRRKKRSLIDPMTPLANEKQGLDELDISKTEFEFNIRNAAPIIILVIIIVVIFVTSEAARV